MDAHEFIKEGQRARTNAALVLALAAFGLFLVVVLA